MEEIDLITPPLVSQPIPSPTYDNYLTPFGQSIPLEQRNALVYHPIITSVISASIRVPVQYKDILLVWEMPFGEKDSKIVLSPQWDFLYWWYLTRIAAIRSLLDWQSGLIITTILHKTNSSSFTVCPGNVLAIDLTLDWRMRQILAMDPWWWCYIMETLLVSTQFKCVRCHINDGLILVWFQKHSIGM